MRFGLELGRLGLPALRDELHAADVRCNAYAERLFEEGHVRIAAPPRSILVEVFSAAELGAVSGDTIDGVLVHARSRGLSAGPLEVAPLLRLAWRDQPPGVRVTVVSPRPTPDESAPRGFYLRREPDSIWLRGYVASDDWVFDAKEHFALVRVRAVG